MSILKLKHLNLCHVILNNENIEWVSPSITHSRENAPQIFVVSPILEVITNNTLLSVLTLLIFIIISTVSLHAFGIYFNTTVKTKASDFYYNQYRRR